jgi:hypothetical protein
LLGAFALLWHPHAQWVERSYANGFYPRWEHAIDRVTAAFPWSLGDLAILLGVAAIATSVVAAARARSLRPILTIVAIAGVYLFWFEAGWGWNYDRAPIETRVRYDGARVNPQQLAVVRSEAIAEINRLAPLAHARAGESLDVEALRSAWLPVVQAGGDGWEPSVGEPKPTIFNPYMEATGTSGFVNPLTLSVQLAGDLLWFERPFSLAHEWSHVAAYAREDEANYIAIVTCTRSSDPVIQYSGWLELLLYLPPPKRYARSTFSPLVWSDFAAIRQRNARHLNLTLAHFSWQTYNVYLKSNRISSGIANYGEVARLVLGIPLNHQRLPVAP